MKHTQKALDQQLQREKDGSDKKLDAKKGSEIDYEREEKLVELLKNTQKDANVQKLAKVKETNQIILEEKENQKELTKAQGELEIGKFDLNQFLAKADKEKKAANCNAIKLRQTTIHGVRAVEEAAALAEKTSAEGVFNKDKQEYEEKERAQRVAEEE